MKESSHLNHVIAAHMGKPGEQTTQMPLVAGPHCKRYISLS